MKFFNDLNRPALAGILSKQDRKLAFLFALLCAERSRVCYWAFCMREGLQANYEVFDGSLIAGFREYAELSRHFMQSKKLQARYRQLDSILIDTEEYGDSLAVQAQCASIALRYAFEVLSPQADMGESASWAAYKNMEVIYTFNEFMNDVLGLHINESELYEREIRVQKTQLKELEKRSKAGVIPWAQIQLLRHMSADASLPVITQIQ